CSGGGSHRALVRQAATSTTTTASPTTAVATTTTATGPVAPAPPPVAGCPPIPGRAQPDPNRPRYTLRFAVDTAGGTVDGDLDVRFTPDLATDRLVFRLWPNGPAV